MRFFEGVVACIVAICLAFGLFEVAVDDIHGEDLFRRRKGVKSEMERSMR